MGTSGLEPPTSRLSGVRSNHLSYAPILNRSTRFKISSSQFCFSKIFETSPFSITLSNLWFSSFLNLIPMVEMRRIELLTPCLQSRCSPSWATPPYFRDPGFLCTFSRCWSHKKSVPSKLNNNFHLTHLSDRDRLSFRKPFSLERRWSSRTFRYGYLVTTSPQSSIPPSTASSGVTGGVYKARERIHRSMLICDY